jgi:single-stranded-DNA-specific exonuclease
MDQDAPSEGVGASPPLLGVRASLKGLTWVARSGESGAAEDIARAAGLPPLAASILAGRGVRAEDAKRYLDPTIRAWMPDPSVLRDLEAAADRIAKAIMLDEPCAVFGDYDVDGGASAALMARYFKALGRPLRVYIPDRMTEGYGPNPAAMRSLKAEGISLCITVDCGAQAFAALDAAAEEGLSVIVADHHLMGTEVPKALAIINPNRPGDASGLGHLCAAGVVLMLLAGVNRALRRNAWFGAQVTKEPDLRQFLDLVALATVCDVVPLTGLNRAFVKQGLKILANRTNTGLAALLDVSGVTRVGTGTLGFQLGPRVNAGGRVGQAGLGAALLASEDAGFAQEAAAALDRFNQERQAIEAAVLELAMEQRARIETRAGLAAAWGEGWHPGVIGIVASRLKDRFGRPAAVFAIEGEIAKASLRSVPGVDVGAAVLAVKDEGLLINGGGHKMAAALTARADRVEEIVERLDAILAPRMNTRGNIRRLRIDAVSGPAGLTEELFDTVDLAGPYGAGNPAPLFAIPSVRLVNASIVGANHISITGVGTCGTRLRAIAFRQAGEPLGNALLARRTPFHLAGTLSANEWGGVRRIELVIEDAAPA